MIGHHYTSEEIYRRHIARAGLCSQSIFETEYGTIQGSWVFRQKLEGLSLLGTCIFQAAKRQTTRICHLEVEFTEQHIHPLLLADDDGGCLKLSHNGMMGDWLYHTAEPALVLSGLVPPENIKLVACYDLLNAINRSET